MASWFLFSKDFDHEPTRGLTIAYKAGHHLFVPEACAVAAEAAGAGERTAKPGAPIGEDQVVENKAPAHVRKNRRAR